MGIKNILKGLLNNSEYFLVSLFFFIFLLFYHINYDVNNSDNIYYFELINKWHINNVYSIKNFYCLTGRNSLVYSIVGIDQFGSSIGIKSSLLFFPYFTLCFFFYTLITSLNFIANKFIKIIYKKVLFLIALSLTIFLFYFFSSYQIGKLILGNYVSAFLTMIILIPTLIDGQNNKNIYKYDSTLILFSMLFFNETAILCQIIYSLSFLIFFVFNKNEEYKKNWLFMPMFFYFLFNLYLVILWIINFSTSIATKNIVLMYRLIPLIFMFIFCFILIIFALDILRFLGYENIKIVNKLESVLFIILNKIRIFENAKWFKKNKDEYIKIIFNVLMITFLTIFTWGIGQWSESSPSVITYHVVIVLILDFTFSKILWKQSNNNLFIYFLILTFLSFFVYLISLSFNISDTERQILWRLTYSSISINGLNPPANTIYLMFLSLCFLICIYHNLLYKQFVFKKIKVNLLSIFSAFPFIATVVTPSLIYSSSKPFYFDSIESNYFGNMSYKTISELSKYNFNNELTFSFLPLPLFNDTVKWNINHFYYDNYFSPNSFAINMLDKPYFKNINGALIKTFNWSIFGNEILKYYSFIVVNIDNALSSQILINSFTKQFKEVALINNQVMILFNTKLSINGQTKFLAYNSGVF